MAVDGFNDGELHREVNIARPLAYEENLNQQLHTISIIRSRGGDWSEALYQLRDLLVGREDAQFFDGIPPEDRERIKAMDDPKQQRKAREAFREMGWDTHVVPWVQGPRGPIFRPTPQDLSHELRLLMGLMNRQKMLQRTQHTSRPPEEAIKSGADPAE